MEVRLTRRYRFSAAHRLHAAALSDAENREVYGKCNNPYGHGHDYTLEVTARAQVDPALGRAFGVDALDAFVGSAIIGPFDRRNLNTEVAEFATLVPTTENLARVIARRLEGAPAPLERVRIWETRRNVFEVLLEPQS